MKLRLLISLFIFSFSLSSFAQDTIKSYIGAYEGLGLFSDLNKKKYDLPVKVKVGITIDPVKEEFIINWHIIGTMMGVGGNKSRLRVGIGKPNMGLRKNNTELLDLRTNKAIGYVNNSSVFILGSPTGESRITLSRVSNKDGKNQFRMFLVNYGDEWIIDITQTK